MTEFKTNLRSYAIVSLSPVTISKYEYLLRKTDSAYPSIFSSKNVDQLIFFNQRIPRSVK